MSEMRRPRALLSVALALVVVAAIVVVGIAAAGGGGGDDEGTTTTPAPSDAPSEGATPPSPSALPPELVECFADQGFDLQSPTELHSAPPQVVQECFGALHQGGGVP
jgi:hypothetical protein